MQSVSHAIRKLVRPGSQPRDREPLFKVGTLVRLKSTAPKTGFTGWGRGKGVGRVDAIMWSDPPTVDVKWPAGRCYEREANLYVVTGEVDSEILAAFYEDSGCGDGCCPVARRRVE